MSGVSLPNGSTFDIAASVSAALTVTAATNANPTDLTVGASHGLIVGDIVAFASGWDGANNRAFKVASEGSTDAALSGLDTTDTTKYPAGLGVGALTKVASWSRLTNVLTSDSSGGDQQFLTYQTVESNDQKNIPTTRNPTTITITVADDASASYLTALNAAETDRLPRVVRVNLANGGTLLYYAIVTLSPQPTLTVNQIMSRTITLSLQGLYTRY